MVLIEELCPDGNTLNWTLTEASQIEKLNLCVRKNYVEDEGVCVCEARTHPIWMSQLLPFDRLYPLAMLTGVIGPIEHLIQGTVMATTSSSTAGDLSAPHPSLHIYAGFEYERTR